MSVLRMLVVAVLMFALQGVAHAQQAGGVQDAVAQLKAQVGLSDEQEEEMRAILTDMQGQIQPLQMQARQLQGELQSLAAPGYDEALIRETAEKFGDVTGEIVALSALLKAKMDSVFTEEQRQKMQQGQ